MDSRLQNLYYELVDELRECFIRILDSADEETTQLKYRGNDPYENREDVGRIILGRESGENLSYAYRLRFNADANKPENVTWFSSERGFSDLHILLGEQDYIVDDLLRRYEIAVDGLTEEDCHNIETLFEEIQSCRQSLRRSYDMDDIKNLIRNKNEDELQNVITPDRESDVEVWKLLYSRNSKGEIVENDITFPYDSDSSLLARTERVYSDSGDIREYPFGLYIEMTEHLDRFFIHRVLRTEKLDDENYNWDKKDIHNVLGFDTDYTNMKNETIPKERVRITQNTVFNHHSYDDTLRRYRSAFAQNLKQYIHRVYHRFYKERKDIDLTGVSAQITSHSLKISRDCSTEEVKEVQSRLGISESDVREQQDKRDIQRLSSNLRAEIVEDLYIEEFCEWIFARSHNEIKAYQRDYEDDRRLKFSHLAPRQICGADVQGYFENFAIQDPSELNRRGFYNLIKHATKEAFNETESVGFRTDKYQVRIEDAVRHMHSIKMEGFDREVIDDIIIPEDTTLIIESDEERFEHTLQKGYYRIKELNSINTIMY